MTLKWKTVKTEEILRGIVFLYKRVTRHSMESKKQSVFDVLHCPNWVNIIALTKDKKVIIVEQYRQGTDEVTWEVPGGVGHKNEPFLETAKRELLEETGYSSNNWIPLGIVDVNPAFMTNQCASFLAMDCEETDEQNLDPMEEIDLKFVDLDEIPKLIKERKITHSLVIAAFLYFEHMRSDHGL